MRPSVHACLRNALKFTNWVLLVTGLAIALVAGFVLLEFERAQARDAADAPAPPRRRLRRRRDSPRRLPRRKSRERSPRNPGTSASPNDVSHLA